ncbi:TIGR00341 family protein [bacterium]|nr:TIGR00341 family protein [bacterium]
MIQIRLSQKERKELISQLRNMAHPNISFYALMVLATLIAAFGLLANSTAVVIGAMLVAPLMGPIFGMTLALVIGDRKLFFDSLLAEATGVVLAILIGALIGSLPIVPIYGSEILSRTQPTLFDAVIALASGLAGGYVLVNPKLNSGIAGVAIATALVPPLAVCGLEIAAAEWAAAGSAFILFITNVFAILLSAAAVFLLAGLEKVHEEGPSRWLHLARTFGPGLVALIGLSILLWIRLVDIVSRDNMEDRIRTRLAEQVSQLVRGAELDSCEVAIRPDGIDVQGVVLSWSVFDDFRVQQLEDSLEAACGKPVRLIVRTYSTHDYDAAGKKFWDEDEELRELQRQRAEDDRAEITLIKEGLQLYLRQLPGAVLSEVYRDQQHDNGQLAFTAEIETTKPINPQQVGEMQQIVADTVSGKRGQAVPVYLRVRQDSVRYADATGYIFEPQETKLPEGYNDMKELLYNALVMRLQQMQNGATLDDLHHRSGADMRVYENGGNGPARDVRIVQATVYSPELYGPADVARFESELSEITGEPVWLQFDNFIRAYIDSNGYQRGFTSGQISQEN